MTTVQSSCRLFSNERSCSRIHVAEARMRVAAHRGQRPKGAWRGSLAVGADAYDYAGAGA